VEQQLTEIKAERKRDYIRPGLETLERQQVEAENLG